MLRKCIVSVMIVSIIGTALQFSLFGLLGDRLRRTTTEWHVDPTTRETWSVGSRVGLDVLERWKLPTRVTAAHPIEGHARRELDHPLTDVTVSAKVDLRAMPGALAALQ